MLWKIEGQSHQKWVVKKQKLETAFVDCYYILEIPVLKLPPRILLTFLKLLLEFKVPA